MGIFQWLDSSVRYGRRLVDSGLVAAQEGGEAFLKEESGEVFLKEAAQKALVPAAIGACIGAVIGCAGPRNSRSKVLLAALAGGAIGYGSGILWESRHLTRSVSSNVFKEIGKVRDQHWLEQNPIDYA